MLIRPMPILAAFSAESFLRWFSDHLLIEDIGIIAGPWLSLFSKAKLLIESNDVVLALLCMWVIGVEHMKNERFLKQVGIRC